MIASSLPPCRHRGAELDVGVHRCHSPKLVGLKLVTAELCRGCYCRDHEGTTTADDRPPRLAACAHLGAAIGRSEDGGVVYECGHPAHGRTMEAGCRSCPDYLFPLLSPRTPVEEVRRHLTLPPRTQPDGWWDWPNVQEAQRRDATACIVAGPPRRRRYRGRGIVLVGGGLYLAAVFVTVRVLRHIGCTLPIELWHLADEIDPAARRLLRPLGIRCVNADRVARRWPFRFLEGHWWKGWQLKPYAIAHSTFREVLLLDADCYPVRDPSFLFEWPGYRDHGAVFWPDLEASRGLFTPQMWALFGIPPEERMPLESGQLLIDKDRCRRELHLTLHYNARADYIYRQLWGDKDTFLMAWRRLGRDYGMMWPSSGFDTHTILQYDDRGEPLFLHRCRDKWRLGQEDFPTSSQPWTTNQYNPRLAHEDFCFRCLDELRAQWSPRPPPSPDKAPP